MDLQKNLWLDRSRYPREALWHEIRINWWRRKLSEDREVLIEIVSILEAGTCPYGHQVGEKYKYPEERGKICAAAFHSIYPYILGIRIGASFPWEDEKDSISVCCPDYKNPVVFKISRE